jgi:hypothetical protein
MAESMTDRPIAIPWHFLPEAKAVQGRRPVRIRLERLTCGIRDSEAGLFNWNRPLLAGVYPWPTTFTN